MKILVVNNNIFNKVKTSSLIKGVLAVNYLDKFRREHEWKERAKVEEDKTYRQVIPYTLIQNVDNGLFLLSKRTQKQTETRLHDRYSLGIGGHIESSSYKSPLSDGISLTAKKEIKEETGIIVGSATMCFQGIILSNIDEVACVHVGVFYHLMVFTHELENEDGKHEHQWEDMKTLVGYYDKMECWSQIVFDHYINAR